MGKHWTKKETEYLRDKWGVISLETISANLNRSIEAIKVKVVRLGLGRATEAQGFITANTLKKILKCSASMIAGWEKWGLPLHRKKISSKQINVLIDIEEFWRWAKDNQERVRWDKLEPLALGREPKWIIEARKKAGLKNREQRNYFKKWTDNEDRNLIRYTEMRISDIEICKLLGRTPRGMRERRKILFCTKKPAWSKEEEKELIKLCKKGLKYREIAAKLNKSHNSIKNKLYKLREIERIKKVS